MQTVYSDSSGQKCSLDGYSGHLGVPLFASISILFSELAVELDFSFLSAGIEVTPL